jgi:protein-disulfide isomerase/uncharacterized membrane protein
MTIKKLAIALVVLCLMGIAVSFELTRIHLFVHTDPDYQSVCALSEGVNCETVAVSPYSVFAGLPVSVWGIAGYVVMGVFSLLAVSNRRRHHPSWPFGILLLLTLSSAVTSGVLAYISATRIDSLCLFCMASYGINAVLFVLCIIAVKHIETPIFKLFALDARALFSRPVIAFPLLIVGGTAVVLVELFFPTYWQTPGWKDLPPLESGVDDNGHHWIGAETPTVTIVEFSDYECPHCRAAHKAIRAFAAKYPNQIRLIHRHLPLDQACHPGLQQPFHKRACAFAIASECAGLAGRFWEMNDALFAIQDEMKTEDVDPVDIAVRLGLNRSDFKSCFEGRATAQRIAGDIREAMAKKLRGTPSFLVGDRLFLGRIPEGEIEALLMDPTVGHRDIASR